MIIDYIGQELIWNLTGTNPYKENRGAYIANIRCQTPKQNEDAVKFIYDHLGKDIQYRVTKFGSIVSKIVVKDAFDKMSEVNFINDFIKEN